MGALQSPVVRWACAAVCLLYVYLGDAGIMSHHVQRRVTEERLEREKVTATPQVSNRESVAESVWMALLDVGPRAQPYDHEPQRRFVHRATIRDGEQRRFWIITILAFDEIAPHGAPCRLAQENGSALAPPSRRPPGRA